MAPKKSRAPARTMTRAQLAAELGVSPKVVEGYVAAGLPCTAPKKRGRGHGNLFDAAEARRWMAANGRTGRPGKPTAMQRAVMTERAVEPPKAPVVAESPPKASRKPPADDEEAQDDPGPPPDGLELPENLAELPAAELERLEAMAALRKTHWQARQARALALETEGRLVDREEVARQLVERIQRVKARHEVMPSRLGWKLVGKTKEEIEAVLAAEVAEIQAEFAREVDA